MKGIRKSIFSTVTTTNKKQDKTKEATTMQKGYKRSIISLLVIVLLLSSVPFAMAAPADVEGTDYQTAVEKLTALNVLVGYPDGTFKPDNTIKRSEFAKIAVLLLGLGDAADYAKGVTVFSDVAADHWASGYINIAVEKGLLKGYPDGTFAPEAEVTYAESITILVRLLGYGPTVEVAGTWPSNYIAKAAALGLTKNVAVVGAAPATRGNVAILADNALETPMWGESGYDSQGKVTYGPTGNTVLSELGITGARLVANQTVTATPLLGGVAPGKVVAGGKTYKFAGDAEKYFGVEANLWLNKGKDEIIYFDVETDEDDIIVGTFDKWDGTKIKVKEDDDSYAFDGAAVIYYNGADKIGAGPTSIGRADLANLLSDVGGVAGVAENAADVRLVLDADGEVAYAAVWQEKASSNHNTLGRDLLGVTVSTGIVDEISSTRITMFGMATIRTKDILDKVEDEDEYLIVVKNGEAAELDDIEEGDAVAYYKISTGSKPINYFVVSDETVEGEVEEIVSTGAEAKFVIDGVKYAVAADVLSTKDASDPAKNTLTSTFLKDFVGEDVVLTLNAMGEVMLAKTSVEVVSGANYGMLIELISGNPAVASIDSNAKTVYYVKVVNKAGDDVVLKFKDNTAVAAGATTKLDSYDNAVDAGLGALVSWKLDSDGYVKEFRYANASNQTIANSGVTAAGAGSVFNDPDYFDAGATNYFVTADTVIWNEQTKELVKGWKQVVNAAGAGGALAGATAYKFDGSKLEYLVIDEAGVASDVEYAIFIEKGVNVDGDTYKLMKADGSLVTYNVKTVFGTAVAKGDMVAYVLDADGEFVAKDVTNVTSTVAAEKGMVVDRSAAVALLTGQAAGRVEAGTITKVDTENQLITIGGSTFKYDEDIVVYEAIKTTELGIVELEDVYEDYDEGYLIETDATSDGKYDILVIVKR